MRKDRPKIFRVRHFADEVILLCVRWYLRYSLSCRDVEALAAERGLGVDHSTIARWVVRCNWTYLYRAIDSRRDTIDCMVSPRRDSVAAKQVPRLALYRSGVRPRDVDGHPAYAHAIADLKQCGELGRRCRCRQEEDRGEPLVPICRRSPKHDCGIRSGAHDRKGPSGGERKAM